MKFKKLFEDKYGFDPITFITNLGAEYFGQLKKIGLQQAIIEFAEKKAYDLQLEDDELSPEFVELLISALIESDIKFPENQKLFQQNNKTLTFTILAQNPQAPKSKGLLQDFKDIVNDDELRPAMLGVYVDKGKLVATDAHKLVIYRTKDLDKYNGQIINLELFLGTKGQKIEFIDAKFPEYQKVIPTDNPIVLENVGLYSLYNLAKSCIVVKKYLFDDIFYVLLKIEGKIFAFNPFLLAELTGFLLAKGNDRVTMELSEPNRGVVFKANKQVVGLLMPLMYKQDQEDRWRKVQTVEYLVGELDANFLGSKKAPISTKATFTKGITKTKQTPKAAPAAKKKQLVYNKFTGTLKKDTTYISRRKIETIILTDGTKLTGADIVDGIYLIK